MKGAVCRDEKTERNREAETYLATALADCDLFKTAEVWDLLASTNDRARALAAQNAPEGTLVLANSQTAGRGRMGRRFVSPQGTGLYMSLLLRPKQAEPGLITACAAVAVWQAVQNLTGVTTQIKWVNDIYAHAKKLCGILAEGQFDAAGQLSSVVLGIGVNLQRPKGGYDPAIEGIVTSLREIAPDRAVTSFALCKEIFTCFADLYRDLPSVDFLSVYRSASCVLGKRVTYQKNGMAEQGLAVAIDDSAHLVVRLDDGTISVLEAGEISLLRPMA